MKARTHGLTEKEAELVKLQVEECESTRDIQNKRLFAGTIEHILLP